jgi:uncharacterized membrane protein (Fun14 family)
MTTEEPRIESDAEPEKPAWQWTKGKIVAVAFAAVLVAAGAVFGLAGSDEEPLSSTAHRTGPAGTAGAEGFGPTTLPGPGDEGEAPAAETEAAPSETISPGLLKGGFSFFVAFAVGFALRMFFRVALLFLGIWAASFFLLASLGWVEIHWNLIGATFEGWSRTIGDQFQSFTAFVNGSLPSAGMGGLGLYTGMRRK